MASLIQTERVRTGQPELYGTDAQSKQVGRIAEGVVNDPERRSVRGYIFTSHVIERLLERGISEDQTVRAANIGIEILPPSDAVHYFQRSTRMLVNYRATRDVILSAKILEGEELLACMDQVVDLPPHSEERPDTYTFSIRARNLMAKRDIQEINVHEALLFGHRVAVEHRGTKKLDPSSLILAVHNKKTIITAYKVAPEEFPEYEISIERIEKFEQEVRNLECERAQKAISRRIETEDRLDQLYSESFPNKKKERKERGIPAGQDGFDDYCGRSSKRSRAINSSRKKRK